MKTKKAPPPVCKTVDGIGIAEISHGDFIRFLSACQDAEVLYGI